MKLIFTISMLFFANFVFAQDDDCKISVKTSPLNLFDPWNGTLTALGAEYKVYNNIASYLQAGVYIPGFNIFSELKSNKGFVFREELKYYLNKHGQTIGDYISLEVSYSQQKYNRTDTIDLTSNNGLKYLKDYSTSRNFTGIVFQYGALLVKLKRLVLDIYGGIGIRFNNISCDLTDNEAEHRKLGDWDNPNSMIQQNGSNIIPRLNLGIKIGYKIK